MPHNLTASAMFDDNCEHMPNDNCPSDQLANQKHPNLTYPTRSPLSAVTVIIPEVPCQTVPTNTELDMSTTVDL
mgnify:CR=1 FL=1